MRPWRRLSKTKYLPSDVHLPQPFCDLALDEEGGLCPGQVATLRDRFRDILPATSTRCSVSIWWQAGPVGIAFRSQGTEVLTQATDDCDADVVFVQTGPRPGINVATNGAIGWYIVEVSQPTNPTNSIHVPMHAHAQPGLSCDEPPSFGFE